MTDPTYDDLMEHYRTARIKRQRAKKLKQIKISPEVERGERVFRTKGSKVKLSSAHKARLQKHAEKRLNNGTNN
jgi:hypothetical protein